ncbi:dTDP-glucose 4,6-dehydratase [Sphaerimonospora thailandensis]|uniref:dTDP-glucose 4,6-dehydratase n=1 Tax=Sphaerimonospora thailandensis TaxID=795644 RepID=A0A8J3R5B1_9ACTN|nr:dTDP-glucose 4,6-dehydratase [Sphaerimonospora thailandensis]
MTGGSGFVGSHLCEALLARDTEVVCVDNFLTSSPDTLTRQLGADGFALLKHDVCAAFDVPGEVDLVLHLASPASPADYLKLPLQTLRAGSAGTLNALELARRKGARFVLASTSEVYGNPLVHPQPETYWGNVRPTGPRSVYDEAKRFAEATTAAYRREFGTDTAIVRIFNTYGPRMRPHDGRVVPTFIRQALSGEPLTVAGDGSHTRSLCYVSDTVDGLLAAAESTLAGPVNLGCPEELTVRAIAELVGQLCGSDLPLTFTPLPADDPARRCPDISLIRQATGWQPRVPLRDGLTATIAWFTGQLATPIPAVR